MLRIKSIDDISESEHDFSQLNECWNEELRCYEEGEGVIFNTDIQGAHYQFSVEEVDFPETPDHFATDKRILTATSPDLTKETDGCFVKMGGWGESTAMFEGAALEAWIEYASALGTQNPRFIGVNPCGRGTAEYMTKEAKNKISAVGIGDELEDVKRIAAYLAKNRFLGKKIYLIGHSMGCLNTLAFIEALASLDAVFRVQQGFGMEVKKVLQFMPVTDQPGGLLRWNFIKLVSDVALEGAVKAALQRGYLDLDFENFADKMFSGDREQAREPWKRTVPDSAKKFVGAALNMKSRFAKAYAYCQKSGTEFVIFEGGDDRVIPRSMSEDAAELPEKLGLKSSLIRLKNFAHSLPMNATNGQRIELRDALKSTISGKYKVIKM